MNQQQRKLPGALSNKRLQLYFCTSELWAEAGLEQEPPALHVAYDWQHVLSLQVTSSYCELMVACAVASMDPQKMWAVWTYVFLHTWALHPPDAPCHGLWAAPCAKPASPREILGPRTVLAALNRLFCHRHGMLPPMHFETSCSA